MLSNPPGHAPLNIEREAAARLHDAVREAEAAGRVRIEVLSGRDATTDKLSGRLRTFQPHLFHFVGHGVHENGRSGALIFADKNGLGVPASAAHLAPLMGNSSVRLAVLNACDTGSASLGDAVSSVAGAMVGYGVPAVIATTRPVLDEPAIMFVREFYRSFFDGYSAEVSLIEARAALNANDWDWSAYTLFAGTKNLDALTLAPR